MNTFEITIQRRTGSIWPVVVEVLRAGSLLKIRSEGVLELADEPIATSSLHYGTMLGKAVFRDSIRDAFVTARDESTNGVRVLLFVEDAALKSWRWERLCAPVEDGKGWDFISVNQRTTFSLYLPSLTGRPYPPIGRGSLRALVVVANPNGMKAQQYGIETFDAEAAVDGVQNSLKAGNIPLDLLSRATNAVGLPTLEELERRLGEGAYTVLHLVCHGRYDADDDETRIYLESSKRDLAADGIDPEALTGSELISHLSRMARLPYLIFLAMCDSSAPGAEQRLGGLAQRLVRELGIPAVVGMTEPVTTLTASRLGSAFYNDLLSPEQSGEVDRALVGAFAGLMGRPDINVPALYSRLAAQPLFSLAVDRSLSPEQVKAGLAYLEKLLEDRSPVLLAQLQELKRELPPGLQSTLPVIASSSPSLAEIPANTLTGVNEICQEALEINFYSLAEGQPAPTYNAQQPFRGMGPFRLEDEFFFGREGLLQKIEDRLAQDRFLAVLGSSGSGKSSLILAGLVPRLKKINESLQIVPMTPTSLPTGQLNTLKSKLLPGQALFIVDQFEEVFTLCEVEEERVRFFAELLELSLSHFVVLMMRADFWGECAPYKKFKERMQARQELIGPMSTVDLRAAIEQQVARVSLRFEADLSNLMLDEVDGEPAAMPLLQHALLELWKRRHGRWLRVAEYRHLGGVKQAIALSADRLYAELSVSDQDRVREIFLRLTQVDGSVVTAEGRRDTRRRVAISDLVSADPDPERARDLIKKLADAVLVVTSYNVSDQQEEVEVAHEALIRHWGKLRTWIFDDQALLRLREGIEEAATAAEENPRDKGLLVHSGSRLQDAHAIQLSRPGFFNLREQQYLARCRASERSRRNRLVLATAVLLFAAMIALYTKLQDAMEQARDLHEQGVAALDHRDMLRAEVLLANAVQANDSALIRPFTRSVDLDIREHLLQARNRGARSILAEDTRGRVLAISPGKHLMAVASSNQVVIFNPDTDEIELRLPKLRGYPVRAAFDSTGRYLAYAYGYKDDMPLPGGVWNMAIDGAIHLRDFESDQDQAIPLTWKSIDPKQHKQVSSITFAAASPTLAVATEDGEIRVGKIESYKETDPKKRQISLLGHTGPVWGLAFSPDETLLASASEDNTVRLWAVKDSTAKVLKGHEDVVSSVAFSPDGRKLASGSADGTVRIWNVESGLEIQRFANHQGGVTAVAFQPEGAWVASACEDQYLRVLDLNSGTELLQLKSYDGPATAIDFSPGGLLFAGGGHEFEDSKEVHSGWMRSWQVGQATELRSVYTGDVPLTTLAYLGPDIVSADAKGAIKIWSQDGSLKKSFAAGDYVQAIAVSQDFSQIASGGNSAVKLWTATGLPGSRPPIQTDAVWAISFQPNGNNILFGGDRILTICKTGSPEPCKTFPHPGGHVFDLSYSPDGRRFATAAGDNSVRLWDAASNQELNHSFAHSADVWALAYDQAGTVIASGGVDRVIRLMSAANLNDLAPMLDRHSGTITSIAFIPNSTQLVSAALDHKLLLWNWRDASSIDLSTDDRPVWWVSASSDGHFVASASLNGFIRIWNLQAVATFRSSSPEILVKEAEQHTGLRLEKGQVMPSPERKHISTN